jgi:hypothetical protein
VRVSRRGPLGRVVFLFALYAKEKSYNLLKLTLYWRYGQFAAVLRRAGRQIISQIRFMFQSENSISYFHHKMI